MARDEAERPQVPVPFIAGLALKPKDKELFRGRADLVQLIDHDLTGDRRAVLYLCGQRRMGKSSLINLLPIQLGTGTTVATVDFQPLSGSALRSHPHDLVIEQISSVLADAPKRPSTGEAWGATLSWLREIDALLEGEGQRLLVAIDEVERVEDGIRAGWASTDFLDFLRATGDALSHVRFLLAAAYPPRALGPHWTDRLISVQLRRLRRLSRSEAESLVREPMPGFPDIYPEGGVERILETTAGHPFLVQLICDALCKHLNTQQRLQATGDDVERAIDQAFLDTTLFSELWERRTSAEQGILWQLARGEPIDGTSREALGHLEDEDFIERKGSEAAITVPMFAEWIAERADVSGGS